MMAQNGSSDADIQEKQRELTEVTAELQDTIDKLNATHEELATAQTKLQGLEQKYEDRRIEVNNDIADAMKRLDLLNSQAAETERYVSEQRSKIKAEWRELHTERNKISRTGNSSAFPDLS